MKQTPLRILRVGLADVENERIHLKGSSPVEKGLTWQSRLSRRIGIHIGVWEHHLGKVWNQHLTSKQLEYHNSKQNKGLACRISQNKHMIEISSEVFMVGPTRARSYITIMYKAVHMTYEASPSRHSQGLFKTQRGHCKTLNLRMLKMIGSIWRGAHRLKRNWNDKLDDREGLVFT